MKFFCVLAACALLLGGLVVCKDAGSPQATAAPAQSMEAAPAVEMDDKARILAAVEEASRYVDLSIGKVELRVLTTVDSQSTIIEMSNEMHKNDLTPHFLAIVNADGSLTHFNHLAGRPNAVSSEAFVKALKFWLDIIETEIRRSEHAGPDVNPHFWITEFTARIENYADHTDVILDIRPGTFHSRHWLRVKGDEVTIESRWRPNPSKGPDTTGVQ